ncbi:MAG: type I methionyl aminopeptidase [Acholeplasmataceae bacterium]|nr:type I methionyl aminopeptidase [Acholeplasmataceae bacterium]
MIILKSKREIAIMREAGKMVYQTRKYLENFIKPGITTKELDKLAEDYIISLGGVPSFKNYQGFPSSICTSVNEEVVHGIPSKRKLKEGDLISLDLGVYYQGYHADSAYTYGVGKIKEEYQLLLTRTKASLFAGIEQAKPNNYISDISKAIENYLKPFGYGIVEEFTGHGIGKDLHEKPYVPNFFYNDKGEKLEPGMTICIEPMVNLGSKQIYLKNDNWTVVTRDRKVSAHFEHMIAITNEGYEILTK